MKELLTALRRTPYQSLAVLSSLFLTLFLSLLLIFCLNFLYGLLGYVESRPQVTIYFQNEVSEANILKVKGDLEKSGKVESVKYISKNDAYTLYKGLNKDNPLLLEMVTPDILPASLEIFAKKPTYLPEIANYLNGVTGKDEVNFQKNVVDKLLSLTSIVRAMSLAFFIFLMGTTIIILMTITHFKVALKKEEIELLRLMGASVEYVRRPFMNQALFLGFVSSTIVYVIFAAIIFIIYPAMQGYLNGVQSLFIDIGPYQLTVWPITVWYAGGLYILLTAFGMGVAALATGIATRKYLAIQRG
jgi:cell division transport system permease protein